ncbi:MAG: hypothetical protein V4506_18035 [Bacteroidota bacterium]
MKHNVIYIIAFLCLSVLLSCAGKTEQTITKEELETPAALRNNKYDISSGYKRSSEDLTEALYTELVDKDKALKTLEEDLKTYRSGFNKPSENFNSYNDKSIGYYYSVNHKIESISDSVLKHKMASFIAESNERYLKTTEKLNSFLKLIEQNNLSIQDQHTVLKIVLTVPLIEKYQTDQLPDGKEFKEMINSQKKLIKRTEDFISHF